MNKSDMIDAIAANTGLSKADVGKALDAQAAVVHQAIAFGDEAITLHGLGKLSVSQRAARTGRNPQTGDEIKIAAKRAPKFSAAKALKDAVNTTAKKAKK